MKSHLRLGAVPLAFLLLAFSAAAVGQSATITTLAVTNLSGGSVTTISSETAVRLNATVQSDGTAVTPGTVRYPNYDRVTDDIDLLKTVTVQGDLPAWVQPERDVGALPEILQLDHMVVLLARSPEREQAFKQLLEEQQDRKSPQYHRWLSAEQIGQQFGVSDHDLAAVNGWLQSQGLQVEETSKSRVMITFGGSSRAVEGALWAKFHTFLVNDRDGKTKRRISLSSKPRIPAALGSVIQGVSGLSETPVDPYVHAVAKSRAELPLLSACGGGEACTHFVTPADFATIFDINSLYTAGFAGTGQRIAIIGRSRVANSDIEEYEKMTGLNTQDPNVLIPPGGVDPGTTNDGDQAEATLDVSRALGTAPSAGIDLVVSGSTSGQDGVLIAGLYEVETVLDPIATVSFGLCEAYAGAAAVAVWDSLASQGAGEGITVFVAAGDSGAAGCDSYNTTPPETQIKSPNYLCSSSYLTCVGGTEFNDTGNPSQYWSSTNSTFLLSALSYIPEGGWNEPIIDQAVYQASASGGGVSAIITKPSWQAGPGVPLDNFRDTPDVAFPSAIHDGYFACFAAWGGDCSQGSFEEFAGTSAAAPSWAGVTAILNQVTGMSQEGASEGNLNPVLYELAASGANDVFHDITVASSGVTACSSSTPSMCNNSTPSMTALTGGMEGYELETGYDQVTGLGSVDVANLVKAISILVGHGNQTINFPSIGSLDVGQSISLNATASSGLAVSYSSQTTTVCIVSGSTASLLAAGICTIQATQGGNTNYAAAQPVSQSFSVIQTAAAAPSFSPGSGTYSSVQLVSLSETTSGASIHYTVDGSLPSAASSTYAGRPLSVATTQTLRAIAVATAYANSSVSSANYTINLAGVAMTLISSLEPASVGQTLTFTAGVAPASGSNIPAGTIAFRVDGGVRSIVTLDGTGRARYSTSSLASGAHAIVATYSGSSTYSQGSASLTEMIGPTAAAPTLSPAPGQYASSQTVTMSDSTSGAIIYYTTNGSTPTAASTRYGGPLSVSATETIQAIAVAGGYSNSAVSRGTYTVGSSTATTTTLAASRNPVPLDQGVEFTATVTAASGVAPTGTVTLANGSTVFATATLSGGVATASSFSLPLGVNSIIAAYSGDGSHASSSSAALGENIVVPTSVELTASANPSTLNQSVTYTATVTAASGGTPAGSITFFSSATVLATVSLSGGRASFATSALTTGHHSITATYSGNSTDAASKSPLLVQTVSP